MTGFAEGAEAVRFAKQPLDEQVPCLETFRSNDGNNVVGVHHVLREQPLAFWAFVQLALVAGGRIDPVLDERRLDALVFLRPAGSAQGAFDEGGHSGASPLSSIIRPLD